MSDIGTIKNTSIESDMEDLNKVIMADVEISDPKDRQDCHVVSLSGIKSRPPINGRAIVINLGGGYQCIIAVDDHIEPDLMEGELDLYSQENGIVKSRLKLLKNGTIEINDGSDNSVRYSKLEEAFNQLKSEYNALLNDYKSHIHILTITAMAGSGGTGTSVAPVCTLIQSIADITDAKIDEIKVP